MLAVSDAAWIDLDEAGNQVAIGLANGSGRPELEATLGRHLQPRETLLGRVRPVEGGLANAVSFNGVAQEIPWCTYGFSAEYNGVDVMLTASHRTNRIYRADGSPTVFYQDSVKGADQIGSEYYDPEASIGCASPQGYYLCGRYSDAAMIEYDAGVNFDLGFIARTSFRSTNFGFDGSITIDSQHPQFRITASQDYPVAGQQVDKVGLRSGWTSGAVLQDGTCVDVLAIGGPGDDSTTLYLRACTYRATYQSRNHDSGSPVFIWPGGDDVTLVGIHWGNNEAEGYSDFSPMGGVRQDFGSMTTERPHLSVRIDGTNPVQTTGTYTYTAYPSGGLDPSNYTYQWSVKWLANGDSVGLGADQTQSVYVGGSGDFEMLVTVTSGADVVNDMDYVTNEIGGGGGERPQKAGPE